MNGLSSKQVATSQRTVSTLWYPLWRPMPQRLQEVAPPNTARAPMAATPKETYSKSSEYACLENSSSSRKYHGNRQDVRFVLWFYGLYSFYGSQLEKLERGFSVGDESIMPHSVTVHNNKIDFQVSRYTFLSVYFQDRPDARFSVVRTCRTGLDGFADATRID